MKKPLYVLIMKPLDHLFRIDPFNAPNFEVNPILFVVIPRGRNMFKQLPFRIANGNNLTHKLRSQIPFAPHHFDPHNISHEVYPSTHLPLPP